MSEDTTTITILLLDTISKRITTIHNDAIPRYYIKRITTMHAWVTTYE